MQELYLSNKIDCGKVTRWWNKKKQNCYENYNLSLFAAV